MGITITNFSRDPLEMNRGEHDVFFDLLGEELNTVYENFEDVKKLSGVFPALDKHGKLLSGMTINVDWSTTLRPRRITVFANPGLGIPDGIVGKSLWVVILKEGTVVASKQGLTITK